MLKCKVLCGLILTLFVSQSCKQAPGDSQFSTYTGAPEARPADDRESYAKVKESPFVKTKSEPLSTFSVDVDTASYTNVRRFLQDESLPPTAAVRVEEMINYFAYDYEAPNSKHPVAIHTELAPCPWNKDNDLLLVGLQAKRFDKEEIPPRNLVFLLDTSGSMVHDEKLPLLKRAMSRLVRQLRPADSIAIVTYSDSATIRLQPTRVKDKQSIIDIIDGMEASGSTNGSDGIQKAYRMARKHFDSKGANRVILATDGDFNVGVTDDDELLALIEEKRETGVFLTVVGVGKGNLKDDKMEMLADHGNGDYVYLDTSREARKAFGREFGAHLVTVAKDVKIQIEFNPNHVRSYRLIGYENRALESEDFNDDKKDAGEMGAGQSVTALYEIQTGDSGSVDALRYQKADKKPEVKSPHPDEICWVKVHYKEPAESVSLRIERHVPASSRSAPSQELRFASAVASFGMLLRKSKYKGTSNYKMVQQLASASLGKDADGDRHEFVRLVEIAEDITP